MKKETRYQSIPVKRLDFSGKDLSGKDFSNTVLIGADFSGSKCDKCNFSGADLSFANFKETDLYEARFEKSVLYVTHFENCNLTRASFDKAFIYGIKFLPYVNVTYCSFREIQIEERRRKGKILNSVKVEGEKKYRIVKLGSCINETDVLTLKQLDCFCCNGYCFEMCNYDRDEKELHWSHIFNRLKRIFKENNFEREAAEFYFQERYWLTKSWYKQDFSGKIIEKRTAKRVIRTICSKVNELICGYGEKPHYVIAWLFGGWLVYSLLYYMKGTFEEPLTLFNSLHYSICNLMTVSGEAKPLGVTKFIAASQSLYGVVFFAILAATIVRKMIRD